MEDGTILLVEGSPQEELLSLRVLGKANQSCRVDLARGGAEALDYLFGEDEPE
ncbi:MAG: hypothetical protein U9Q81_15790 [Pseudomonadota bacterium]|nr:hypothetical protein [Pseudomonadota bacterium]